MRKSEFEPGLDEKVSEVNRVEGQIIMPFYIICDVSYSMYGDIAELNKALGDLVGDIVVSPVVDDLTMLGLIT